MSTRVGGSMLAKALQGMVICGLIVSVVGLLRPAALALPELWFVAAFGVLANAFQPRYRAFEGSRTPQDQGTARQILWTVLLTQVLAVVELMLRFRASWPLDWLTWFAGLAMIAGLALRSWAVMTLGRWFTWNVAVQVGQPLIRRGPYRFMRHPSYTGAWCLFVASCLLLHSYVSALIAAICLLLAFSRRIRHEERLMLATFPGYETYMKTTGALFPRLPIGRFRGR
jgi:protein-S-isoprenylcysteine O-methyltransferase